MSFTASLSSCRAKLRQARVHRVGLASQIEQYFAITSNRPILSAELEPTGVCHIFRIVSVPQVAELQETVAIIVGDCVHNIRSALDHLVFQLACVNKNGKVEFPHRVQFPIVDTAVAYAKEAKKWLSEVRKDHQTAIESYQPYHGGAGRPDSWSGPYIHQLALLQQLSNWDKHRLLNPVLIIPAGAEIRLPLGIGLNLPEIISLGDFQRSSPFRNAGERLEIGVEIYRGKLLGADVPSTIPNAGYVIPHIALEEKRPIAPTLERLENYVDLILNDFQARLTSP